MTDFIPSAEWQEIDPDQPLPPGLEIRMDLEGGKSFARLPTNGHHAAEPANLAAALDLAARGWYVFPCKPDKTPAIPSAHKKGDPLYGKCTGECEKYGHGFHDATVSTETIQAWWIRWPDALIGIYCQKSGIFALDVDIKGDRNGWQSLTDLQQLHGEGTELVVGPIQQTPSGGHHLIFNYPAGLEIPNNANKLGPGLDLRSNGYICSGGPYTWLDKHGPDSRLTDAPAWLLQLIGDLGTRKNGAAAAPDLTLETGGDPGAYWGRYYLARTSIGNRNENGFALACQLRDSGLTQGEAEQVMLDYARGVPGEGYTEREALASLQQAYKASRREAAHLPGIYSRNGHQAPDQPPTWGSMPAEDLQPDPGEKIHLTDQGNARRFALQHGAKVKYTKAWGWLIWDGRRWCDDETGLAMRLAKQTVKQLYREAEQAEGKAQAAIKAVELAADRQDPQALAAAEQAKKDARRLADALLSWAIKSQGAARLEAILTLAKSEPEIAARVSDFDNDPWLLNCENGLLDLRNAQLKPHDPSYKVTKLAGTLYDPAATCPTWLAFLARIFDGDQKTIAFLQRAAGYSLTGDTGEQCLFFSFGKGANGKSTFMNAMQAVLADYAAKIRAETILVKKLESIPEDVARLAGVRFALSAELTEGRLNEGLVKDLTGGDKQAARFLYQKTFEFWPTLKLWMYGNEKPTIAGQNDGIWRRIRMIPFEVTIPEPERDSKLPEKLRAELPGILAWAVRGCLEWQRAGLQPTEKINQATREYREEQDLLGQFFAACCVFDPPGTQIPHSETSGDLLEAFKQFTGFDMKPQTFSKKMRERGFKTSGRDPSGRALYSGIKLLPTTANP